MATKHSSQEGTTPMAQNPKPATTFTADVNKAALAKYAMQDRADFHDVDRGFIAGFGDRLVSDDGTLIYDGTPLAYIADDAPAPDSVNPSLWRQSQLIKRAGLYEVVPGLYQVRLSAALTIVDAPDGLVIIDTSTSVRLAKAGLELFRREMKNDKPVVAVIYTHTHFDHYAGVKGVVEEADVVAGRIPIIAPGTIESFDRLAIGENVVTGHAMSRRMAYTFGLLLPPSDRGRVTIGLSGGFDLMNTQMSYISPTDGITRTGEVRTLGGWTFEFLYAPDTEAPEEFHIWIPEIKALTCAENANHTMHNIQTLRGARTRDARNFARYIDETLVRWGDEAEVHWGSHTWPVWGNANVVTFLESQRDMYKYIHDQALRQANQGLTPLEAAEIVELPDALGKKWYNRFYHGGLHHNVRAVFSKELGFWDGDPASILPLLPEEHAKRHVALIGRDKILAEGSKAFDAGDYRWAVQILHHLVFADPGDVEAKQLQADAYEQLGYQQEVPQYRAIFLTAAKELREGVATKGKISTDTQDTILAMPIHLLFDFAGVHLIGERANDLDVRVNFTFSDFGDEWTMWVRNGVLNARKGHVDNAQLTVAGPKVVLAALLLQPSRANEIIEQAHLSTEGDLGVLDTFASVMDTFEPDFNIVTP
ncbi:alkyl sulfatase BDS1-like metallo-beta-lactamase superfamily hydrolase [Rhizobium azooxidifex]|uniref:Alkyl sulfatase BDS1-like metallo-beta-lactamase superfamily hydrolase n=1 Tax=Mycoplana azooxidifex TaxID=1636188 RepID=A0A7W6DDT2_9HYPH|nr:alkyl sulfatase dimerization domain-containing protein [Mycoplana azooxidifex]MBB3979406.1 alkyl sulfatase BDS1-like metallo-beta-lactamase superfamily hydrolase [Mycoplana azooxidifex]